MLKATILLSFFLTVFYSISAQTTKIDSSLLKISFSPLDKSPLDFSYYPNNFPTNKLSSKNKEILIARLIYSRPQKNGRVIFGNLVEYGKVWRFGANESAEIEFYQKVKMGNSIIEKGRYSIFCIPETNNWTIILNRDLNNWGNFNYKSYNDLTKLKVPVIETNQTVEAFSIYFQKTNTKTFNMVVAWDNLIVAVPFTTIP
jgi:hypothetical protein